MLQSLAAEFAITLTNGEVWLAISHGLLFAGVTFLFGAWVTRRVGLLASGAPAGEVLGVGLAAGLIVISAWWAAIWSGGRSSFTPVAIGFAIAIALAVTHRAPSQAYAHVEVAVAEEPTHQGLLLRWSRYRSLVLTTLAAGLFIVAIALFYGSTLAPSPRDGVQPVEANDEAYYSVLSRDLATTGSESTVSTSGFTELPGLPAQAWYHWGELWLASAMITVLGSAPLAARYFVVLPVLLLAAAALTGTFIRRVAGTSSRWTYIFGFVACLLLSSIPLVPGPFFSARTVGLVFGLTSYVMAAMAVLLALYSRDVLGSTASTRWELTGFVGTGIAFILPAHLIVAVLGLVGVGSVWAIRVSESVRSRRRLPVVSPVWRRTLVVTLLVGVATMAWGLMTDHGIASSSQSIAGVSPFNDSWRGSVTIIALGSGALLAIPLAWFVDRVHAPARAELFFGAMMLVVVGALIWGARLGDYNMFHVFFAGIAVFAVPVAALAVWVLWARLRDTHHPRLAAALVLMCAIQLEVGVFKGLSFLEGFAPGGYPPIPVSLLSAIKRLPADAKLAYACQGFEEISFVNSKLLSIDAHTGRRVVPMCFEADVSGPLLGAPVSPQTAGAGFASAPQSTLYPDATARPSPAAVTAFLRAHGIDYVYADAAHPNTLVPDAVLVAAVGDAAVLRIP